MAQPSNEWRFMKLFEELSARQLVVVTGKGGVGKTTLAAAIARLLAARGRRTLLLETDPRESLHQLLGTEPSGGRIVRVGARLSAQNLQPMAVVEGLVREKVKVAALANLVLKSVVFQQFAQGAPGLKEMAVLGYALRTVRGEYRHKAEVVVLDAPATGHGASMLAAPLVLADAVGGGQIGDMAQDLAAFIADPRRCGVVLATLAEEMPVQETIELVSLLGRRMGRRPEWLIANALYPPMPPASRRTGVGKATLELWQERRAVNERELDRLRDTWDGPLAELPLLPLDRGPALLDEVARRLEEQLA